MAGLGFRFSVLLLAVALAGAGSAATFGTVIPISGPVSDIALDDAHGRLYAANFGAYRVEVIDTATKTLLAPISVAAPPSSVAVSPDGQFLVIGEYEKPVNSPAGGFQVDTGGLTTVNLNTGRRQHLDLNCPVLTVSFGADGQALVVCRNPPPPPPPPPPAVAPPAVLEPNIFLLNPASNSLLTIGAIGVQSVDLPLNPTGATSVPLSTPPANIIQAGAGVSGDLQTIVVLAAVEKDTGASSSNSVAIRYNVATHSLIPEEIISTPPIGPRTVSVDQTGGSALTGWFITKFDQFDTAQFPAPNGAFALGSHVWDRARNLIYADMPTLSEKNVLHVLDTDNLTVRERIQLRENLTGKSLLSSDDQTMYSASASGVTILPIGQLPVTPQVASLQEDVMFQADACSAGLITQTLAIGSVGVLGAAPGDFTLSLPSGTSGITFSTSTGTTPAQIQVTVDPTVFQGAKGTTAIPLTIASNSAVNLPMPVRLLINTKDVSQHGTILNVPGKIVDMLADPARGRLYLLRQDINAVLVMDMATQRMIPAPLMRTGNTPVQMTLTTDQNFLIVGNDNSQIATVLDLNLLQQSNPIVFPAGNAPRSIGVVNGNMFAIARNAGEPNPCSGDKPAAFIDHVDFVNRVANTPCTLNGATTPSIFSNSLGTPDGALMASPSNQYMTLELADGNVAEYDVTANAWVASRNDLKSLGGPYGALWDGLYIAGTSLLNAGLAPIGLPFPASDGTASGEMAYLGVGLRTTSTADNAPGVIQFFDPANQNEFLPALLAESPVTRSTMQYPPIGQIGESVLSFTRSLAISPDRSTIFVATVSGVTVLPGNFYVPLPKPLIASVVNTADLTSAVADGGAININGSGLAGASAQAPGVPWPTSLGGACVTVNNIAMPLLIATPGLLVGQLPYTVSGSATMVVRAPGGISNPFTFTSHGSAPAIFHTGSSGSQTGLPAVYRDDDGQVLGFSNPVHPDSNITIYLTGLGTATPLPALGNAAVASPPSLVDAPPTVTLGGQSMTVTSAVMSPGWPTVYTLKVRAPHAVQPGYPVPLTITGGASSTTLQVRVVSP